MRDLTWSDTLSVAVDEVDEDHKRLVDLFNVFLHAMADGETPAYLEAVLDELVLLTAWHFKHEERLMLKYAYPGIQEHKQEHQELLSEVDQYRQKLGQAGKQLSEADVEYLEHWLVEHILTTDMKMGDFLLQAM